jgi:hypothetical protein
LVRVLGALWSCAVRRDRNALEATRSSLVNALRRRDAARTQALDSLRVVDDIANRRHWLVEPARLLDDVQGPTHAPAIPHRLGENYLFGHCAAPWR